MAQQLYGYIRVSTKEQHEDRQLVALAPWGIPRQNLFIDKISGKDFARPAYRRLIRRLRPGDLLIIKSIDRLGRNYREIMEQWRIFTKEKNADVRVLDMPLLDTTAGKDLLGTFIADMVLQLLSFVAENERTNIRQRQAEGIAAAQARGVRFGRPAKDLPENFDLLYDAWRRKEISRHELCRRCDLSISSIYKKTKGRRDYPSPTGN